MQHWTLVRYGEPACYHRPSSRWLRLMEHRAFPFALKPKSLFEGLTLTQQFLAITALILTVGMVAIGNWVGRQIEESSIHQAASMAAIYVESILVEKKKEWRAAPLEGTTHDALDRLFLDSPLQQIVLRFKFWHPDGTIFYSNDHAQIGKRLPMGDALQQAFRGEVSSRVVPLERMPEDDRALGERVLEIFVPVREGQEVVAVAEFYYSMAGIDGDVRIAQRRSWGMVALAMACSWLLLHGLVRRANGIIVRQQRDLRTQVVQRDAMLAENARMQDRLREAGARTTALNETFLQRVAAHLHDGPAQDLALALLRFENIVEPCDGCARMTERWAMDIATQRDALNSSLDELRTIASGLRIPMGIEGLSLVQTVQWVVRDFERKYEQAVALHVVGEDAPTHVSMAVKITAYRMIQEALANGWWHACGSPQSVRLSFVGDTACIEVRDEGPGFDLSQAQKSGRLGLALLFERVKILGGTVKVDSSPGCGTCIAARLPLSSEEITDV